MTIPWQSPTDQDFYYDSPSDHSPLTPRVRDAVPMGTVASRIMELQKLAISSRSHESRSPVTRRREISRSGFGRRIEPKFGPPASRSSKPDEEIYVNHKHSILGLNSQRGNHVEDHALVGGRAKWDRTTGLHGQLQPSGLGARVQFEATSPWRVMPKGNLRRNSKCDYNKQDKDTIVKSSNKTQVSSMAPLMSPLPSASHHCAGETSIIQGKFIAPDPPKSGQRTAIDQRKMSSEWLSFETTSTMRRESVKDLYNHYGIQRPAGLVSPETVAFNPERTRPFVKYKYCHVCTLPRSLDALECKCGHSFCRGCQCLSPDAIITSDRSGECIENVLKCDDGPLREGKARIEPSDWEVPKQAHLEQQTVRPKPKQQSIQAELNQQQTSKKHRSSSAEQLDSIPIPTTFPALRLEHATPSHGSRGMRPRYAELPDSLSVLQQTTIASETVTSVRGSPFAIADALSSTYPLNKVPIGMQVSQVESQDLRHGHHHRPKRYHQRGLYSSSSPNLERASGCDSCDSCDNSGCHATHQGHRPYRHGNTCTRKRRRYPEETDSGYMAGASHLEELEIPRQRAEPESGCEKQVFGHDRIGEQHLSSCQTENSPIGKLNNHGDNQLTHREADDEREPSPQGNLNSQKGVQYSQEYTYSQDNEGDSFNKNGILSRAKFHSNNPPRADNDCKSKLSALDCSSKRQVWVDEDQNQLCENGQREAHHHVHSEPTEASLQVAAGNTIASDARLASTSISPRPPTIFSEVASSYPAEQSVNALSAPKAHKETKSPDWLTDDTAVPSLLTNEQETSIMRNNQARPDVHTVPSDNSKQEDPMKVASQPGRNVYQSQSKHSADICTGANPQDLRKTMTAVPSAAAEEKYLEHRTGLNAGLTTDTSSCATIQPSGDISPRKFQPASRRLSAFFQLQEQNIVSLLNKRLRQHQDELKRLDIASDGKHKVTIHKTSLDQEQDRQENKLETELEEGDSEKIYDRGFSTPSLQLIVQGGKAKALGTDWLKGIQDTSSESACSDMKNKPLDSHHDCAWKRMAPQKQQDLSGAQKSAKAGEEAIEIGIKGITIVIHLEGREDVVIKADLSQGI